MSNFKPTDSELEILHILWENGPSSVRYINDMLNERRDVGYTTTLKLLQIMFEKGLVLRDDSAKTHIYRANISQEKTQQQLIGKMVHNLFGGSASQLVMRALGTAKPSKEEIAQIQQLLDSMK